MPPEILEAEQILFCPLCEVVSEAENGLPHVSGKIGRSTNRHF